MADDSIEDIPVSLRQEQHCHTHPYSPDLAPYDFWLFPALKKVLRGKRFSSDQEAKQACNTILSRWSEEKFSKTIAQKWAERWETCIQQEGRYFEKDTKM